MPPRSRLPSTWKLIYSTFRDGFSLSTLYSKSRKFGSNYPCVLVIKDSNDAIFGAYTSEGWAPRIGHYGSGECFLWKVLNVRNAQGAEEKLIKSFQTTSKNMFYMISEHDFMAIGCGYFLKLI